MFFKKVYLAIVLVSSFVLAGDAPIQSDSKNQQPYVATFKQPSGISGCIKFEPANNGSVLVEVDLDNLPSTGGPFPYHIHQFPVPNNVNCTGTGGHFNPFNGSVTATSPAAKEVGDLAGKHGNITTSKYSAEYVDNYLSLNPKSKAFIGGLSIVIHASDNSRLACANISELFETSGVNSTSTTYVVSANEAGNWNIDGFIVGASLLALLI
ncbi:SOD4 [Candida oxycetoniae]|uniref:superoxide dismutase n=1 Tax=Candida oxycetoniae TaxID=497107 RepID=A0AAI9STL7_9ASCO|nr:SOD4 [Candida oxycetoniae]KAI3402412.2 SOD4 [Candida oxycetoniae]